MRQPARSSRNSSKLAIVASGASGTSKVANRRVGVLVAGLHGAGGLAARYRRGQNAVALNHETRRGF